jgi:CHAT domain-containing protein/Tfp pilus assembly protein PilF
MLPVKVRSKAHGLCSIVLVCLCVTVLLVLSPVRRSNSVMTETASSDELVQVDPGKSRQGDITAGAKAVFGVSASAGTLLRFSIDKGDLALTTIVYGPKGTELAKHVSESVYDPKDTRLARHVSEDFEVVELSVPVDVSGSYRIEIQSREKVDKPRPYKITVDALTPITLAGRKDSEARQAMATAGDLRATWKEASLRQAILEYEKAAGNWTSLGNLSSASQATLKSGDVYFLLSEYQEALSRYQSAATLASKARDPLAEAKALSHMGRLYSYTGKNKLAHEELTKAINVLGPIDANTNPIVKNTYGEVLSNIGEVIYSKNDMVKSREQFDRALKFLAGDRKGEARAHLFAGYIAGNLGVRDKGIAELSEALKICEETNDKSGEGLARNALSVAHAYYGKPNLAIDLRMQAIEIFRDMGDRKSEALALNATGQLYQSLKDYATALSNYEKALQIFHDTGAVDFEPGTIFKVAQMHRLMKHLDQALPLYERCLKLSRATGQSRTEANALTDIAIVYGAQGRSKEALQQYDTVLKFYERSNDRRGLVVALNELGTFLLQDGKRAEALAAFERALPISEETSDTGTIIKTFCNLARAERALGSLDEALSLINRSLKKIEDLRRDVGSPDLRVSYFSGVRENYELGIEILMDLDHARPGKGYAAEALVMSEKSRARALLDLIRESGADLRRGVSKDVIDRETELSGLIYKQGQYQTQLKQTGGDPAEIAELENQIRQFKSDYQQLEAQIREQDPRALSLSRFQPLSLKDIQGELRQDDVLLEISLGDERSHLWMVTPDSFQHFELPDRKTIEEMSVDVYKSITRRQQLEGEADTKTIQAQVDEADKLFLQKAPELSQMLFGHIATQLGTKRLVLVIEGALQLVPFAALPAPPGSNASSQWLMLDHEIVQLPSIATLRAIRAAEKKNRDAADKIAAVIADPVFTRDDARVQHSSLAPAVASAARDEERPQSTTRALDSLRNDSARLIHSSEEADAIAEAAPRGTTMVAKGFDATRETALNAGLGEYQIIHFATHGFLDNEHPEMSGIILTTVDRNGVDKNGVMSLHDIYNMDLSAELTVLSACQTALGKDMKGEGFVGLTHSFISAGSRSVVASLWKVDDRATAALMADFYQSMLQKGMTPAAALRASRLKVMQDKRWSNPYYWAGFVVQGEYTNHINIETNSRRNLGVILLLSLLLITCGLIVATKRRKNTKKVF